MPTIHNTPDLNGNYDLRMPKSNQVQEFRTVIPSDPRKGLKKILENKTGHKGENINYQKLIQNQYFKKLA